MSRERIASHLLDVHETGAENKKEGEDKEQEKPDAHLRHFLDDEVNPQETRENTEEKEGAADSEKYEKNQEDKSEKRFEGIEMEGESSGKLKIEKGEGKKESLTKFFVANAEQLRVSDVEKNISVQQWAEGQAEQLLSAQQERVDVGHDVSEDDYVELNLSDPENVKIKESDVENKQKESTAEVVEDEESSDVYEQQKEKTVESDREKQGDNKQDEIINQAEQPTIESTHQKDEEVYNEKMLQFKLGDLGLSTQEAADTTFADLSQTQEGKALNDSVKQLGAEKGLDAPADDENITDYLSRSMEGGKINWDDIDALAKKNENKKER